MAIYTPCLSRTSIRTELFNQAGASAPAFSKGQDMDAIIAFVASHWVEWLFALATAALAWLYRGMSARLKVEQARSEAVATGVQALLRESIVTAYNKYSEKGACPIYAKDSLRRVYSAYHDLGGNDVATELYDKLIKMPEKEKEPLG